MALQFSQATCDKCKGRKLFVRQWPGVPHGIYCGVLLFALGVGLWSQQFASGPLAGSSQADLATGAAALTFVIWLAHTIGNLMAALLGSVKFRCSGCGEPEKT